MSKVSTTIIKAILPTITFIPLAIKGVNNTIRVHDSDDEDDSFDKAKKEYDNGVPSDTYFKIRTKACRSDFLTFNLVRRARSTNDWVNYCRFYMTTDNSNLIPIDDEETKEFINSISSFAGFGRIYEESFSPEIDKYDIGNDEYDVNNSKFLVDKDELEKLFKDSEFQEKMKLRKLHSCISTKKETVENQIMILDYPTQEELSTPFVPGTGDVIDKDGMKYRKYENETVIPLFSIVDNPYKNQERKTDSISKNSGKISNQLFLRLENSLSYLLGNHKYYYDIDDETKMVKLVVFEVGDEVRNSTYLIDNGRIMGGTRISILANYVNSNGMQDTIFVDVNKHKDIVSRILRQQFYYLSPEEVDIVSRDYFADTTIYHYIDFTDTGWMDNLSDEERKTLEENLTKVSYQLSLIDKGPRLRFRGFNGLDEFVLVSDDKVYSPFAKSNITSRFIAKNIRFRIKSNEVKMIIKR